MLSQKFIVKIVETLKLNVKPAQRLIHFCLILNFLAFAWKITNAKPLPSITLRYIGKNV